MRTKSGALRILCVDDEPMALLVYKLLLEKDYELSLARSAEAALELVLKNDFDVVISDYQMGRRDGIWLLDQVRSRSPKTVRVLASGGTVPDLEAHLASKLVQHFIAKPFPALSLLDFLETVGLPEKIKTNSLSS